MTTPTASAPTATILTANTRATCIRPGLSDTVGSGLYLEIMLGIAVRVKQSHSVGARYLG